MQTPQTIVPFVKSQDGLRAELAPADLNLDPLSMDAGNYARHGTDNGIFIDGNDILANDGENLAQIDPVDGGITVKESKIVDIATHVASDAIEEYDDSVEDRLNALRAELNQAIQDGDAAVIDELESEVARLEELISEEKLRVPQILAGDGIAIANGATPAGDPTQTISVKVASPDSGLGADSNGMFVRVKDGGGILRDTYGLSVDKTIIDDEVDDKLRTELGEYVKKAFIGADKKLHVIDRCGEETVYDIKASGDIIIDGYVTGSGSFDDDGNCHITVTPNVSATPSVWYVGKTNAEDKWGDDENGKPWGSTQDHPFATLGYAITQTNKHAFPGNTIQIKVLDGGSYKDNDDYAVVVNCNTYITSDASSHPSFRGNWAIKFSGVSVLSIDGIDFRCTIAQSLPINGQRFFDCTGSGLLVFSHGCKMIIDSDNFGKNTWGFIRMHDSTTLCLDVLDGQPALYLELENDGTTHAETSACLSFFGTSNFSPFEKNSADPNLVLNAPAGTKMKGRVIRVYRCGDVEAYNAGNIHDGIRERLLVDWNIADDSELTQVDLHNYSYLRLPKNTSKGQALPGSSVGSIGTGAEYNQVD